MNIIHFQPILTCRESSTKLIMSGSIRPLIMHLRVKYSKKSHRIRKPLQVLLLKIFCCISQPDIYWGDNCICSILQ